MKEILIMEDMDATRVIGKILLAEMAYDNLCNAIYKMNEANKQLPTIEFAYGGQIKTFDENPITFHFSCASLRLQPSHELEPVQSKKDVIMAVGLLERDIDQMLGDGDELSVGTLSVVKAVKRYVTKINQLLGVETKEVTIEPTKQGIKYFTGDQYKEFVSEGKCSSLFGQRIGNLMDIDDLYATIGWLCKKYYNKERKSEKEP